ncbi:uncharacterized protein LOC120216982 [Hibiscus syriacus]|uniref:uncharacterized protein LOC120216982 n=1 Tax=Hibiscus syriacus TaxID=106335 RepID=UPI001923D28D|nr:uncharacterized protein LOC120216982 [Hibiscus syriacus]
MRGPRITHILYTDASILFIKNSIQEAQRIKELIYTYELLSGQTINSDKSSISPCNREKENSNLQLHQRQNAKRIQGWTKNLLSFGGREVFLKAVAQAFPTYAMSCYLLSEEIIDDIMRQIRTFWWSGRQDKRG